MVGLSRHGSVLTPRHALFWAGWCFAMAMVLPIARIGVDWPTGWQIVIMAALGSPSLFIAPGDDYVLACCGITLGLALFAFAWVLTAITALRKTKDRGGPVRLTMTVASVVLIGGSLLPLADAGLLGGVHAGLAFLIAAPPILGYGVRPRRDG